MMFLMILSSLGITTKKKLKMIYFMKYPPMLLNTDIIIINETNMDNVYSVINRRIIINLTKGEVHMALILLTWGKSKMI